MSFLTKLRDRQREIELQKTVLRRQTIVERVGIFTTLWIILWAVLAGACWMYVYLNAYILFETKSVTIYNIARADEETIEKENPTIKEENLEEKNISKELEKKTSIGEFSAYNADPRQTDDNPFTMASGKRVYEGAIANNCLPFGTKVEVGGKVKIVEDRMNSRYDCNYFDIFMWKYDDAIQYGRKTLEYRVIE